MNEISKYYNSFSGTDTLAFMLLPETPPITLGALTTVSYSVYRDKKPVNVMGNINVKGFTRGTRVVAGTLIFTLINKHWINDVVENCPWLKNFKSLKADELPLFDIMIVSANEYGTTASMFIYGVDVTDESQVLSVEDLFTENQFSYVARDVDTFDSKVVGGKDVAFRSVKELSGFNDWTILTNGIVKTGEEINDKKISDVQRKLIELGYAVEKVSGNIGKDTEESILKFQEDHNMPITGYLDSDTEKKIIQNEYLDKRPVISSDKNGSLVYKEATIESDIVLQLPYSTKLVVLSKTDEWYKTTQGCIHQDNISILDLSYEDFPSSLTSVFPFGTILTAEETTLENSVTMQQLLDTFEINLLTEENLTAMVEVVSYYSGNRTLSRKKAYEVNASINREITLKDFHNLFIFDEGMEEAPHMTEIFLTINRKTYKWVIKHR